MTAVKTVPAARSVQNAHARDIQRVRSVRSAARIPAMRTTLAAKPPPATMWRTSHQPVIAPHSQPTTPDRAR